MTPASESRSSSGSARRWSWLPGTIVTSTLAQRRAELLEEGAGRVERGAEREVAQLDHVAEQDHAVGAGDLLQQQAADLRQAQHVLAAGDAEVEVGEDRGPHSLKLLCMPSFGDELMAPANGLELCYQEMGDRPTASRCC